MAKVTGKFQITLPKAVVDRSGIRVGDELELRPIGRSIQIDRRTTPTRLSCFATGSRISTVLRHVSEPARDHPFARDRAAGRARNCTCAAALVTV